MTFRVPLAQVVCVLILCSGVLSSPQTSHAADKQESKAQRESTAEVFAAAERDYREITKRDPSNIVAQMNLGHALFRQEKYAEAVAPYEKARALEASGKKLTSEQHRVLVDQLAMSYGISGDLKKAHALLESAIRQDPEYPLNYYNLACAYAEDGDKGKVLENLSLAFQHKGNVIKGEEMPDPRTDSSFQKYTQDADFVKLMKKLGFE